MPNNIKNRLIILGSTDQVEAVKTFLKGENRQVDFNRIVPMPAILTQIGMVNSQIIDAAKKAVGAPYDSQNSLINALERESRLRAPVRFDLAEDQQQFELCCQAYQETSYVCWYDWTVANWGTKWNAYGFPDQQPNDYTLCFETAWSGVHSLIRLLAKQFPDVNFKYDWADEDTGYNVGRVKIIDGVEWIATLEDGSKQAYELAFELDTGSAENYRLIDGAYKYVEEE